MKRNFIFGLLGLTVILSAGIFFSNAFQNVPCVNAAEDSKPPCAKTLGSRFIGYIIGDAFHINSDDGSGIGIIKFTQNSESPLYGVCVDENGLLSGEAWTNGHGKLVFDGETNVRKEGCGGNPEVSSNTNFSGCGYFYINTTSSAWTNLGGLKTATNIFESGLSSAVSILGSFTGKIGERDFSIKSNSLQFIPNGITPITISINPLSVTKKVGEDAVFTATLKGTTASKIKWEVAYREALGEEMRLSIDKTASTDFFSVLTEGEDKLKIQYTDNQLQNKYLPFGNNSSEIRQYLKIIAYAENDLTKFAEAAFWLDGRDANAPVVQSTELYLGEVNHVVQVKNADKLCVQGSAPSALDFTGETNMEDGMKCESIPITSAFSSQFVSTYKDRAGFCGLLNQTYTMTALNSNTGKTGNGAITVRSPYAITCDEVINPVDKTKKKISVSCSKMDASTKATAYVTIDGEKLACDGSITKDVSSDISVSSVSISFSASVSCDVPVSCGQSTGKPSDFRVARVSANSTHLSWKDTTLANESGKINTLIRLRLTPTSTESKSVKINDVGSGSVQLSWANTTTWAPFETRIDASPTSTFATGTISKIISATSTSPTSTLLEGLTELTKYNLRLRACSPINPKNFPVTPSITKSIYTKWKTEDVSGEVSDVCQLNPAYATTTPTTTLPITPSKFAFPSGDASVGTTFVEFNFEDNSKLRSGYEFYLNNTSVGSITLSGNDIVKSENIDAEKFGNGYKIKIKNLEEGKEYNLAVRAFGTAKNDTTNIKIYSLPLRATATTDYDVDVTAFGSGSLSLNLPSGCSSSNGSSISNASTKVTCDAGKEFTISAPSATIFEINKNATVETSGSQKIVTVTGDSVIKGTLCNAFSVTLHAMSHTAPGSIEGYSTDDLPRQISSDASCNVSITAKSKSSYSVFWAGCGQESDLSCTKTTGGNVYVGYFPASGGISLVYPDVDQIGIGGNFNFKWQDSTFHDYKLCLNKDGEGCEISALVSGRTGGGEFSINLVQVLSGGTILESGKYYWYVASSDGNGNIVGYSPVRVFGYGVMDVSNEPTPEEAVAKAKALKFDAIVKEERQVEAPEFASSMLEAMNGFVSKKVNAFLGAREALMGNILGIDHMGNNLQASLISKNPVKELYDVFALVLSETNSIMGSMIAQAAGGGIQFGGYTFKEVNSITYPAKPTQIQRNVSYAISQDYASVYDTNLEPGVVYGYILTENGNTYYGAAETLPKEGIYGSRVTVTTDLPTDSGINQCQKHNVCSKATKFLVTKKWTDETGATKEQSYQTNNECTMNSDCEYVGKFQERGGQER